MPVLHLHHRSCWTEVRSCKDWVFMGGVCSCEQTGPPKALGVAVGGAHQRERRHTSVRTSPAWLLGTYITTLMVIFPMVHSLGYPFFNITQGQIPGAEECVNYACFNHFNDS